MKAFLFATVFMSVCRASACEAPMGPVVVWPSEISNQELPREFLLGKWQVKPPLQSPSNALSFTFAPVAQWNRADHGNHVDQVTVTISNSDGSQVIAAGELVSVLDGYVGRIQLMLNDSPADFPMRTVILYRTDADVHFQIQESCGELVDLDLVKTTP